MLRWGGKMAYSVTNKKVWKKCDCAYYLKKLKIKNLAYFDKLASIDDISC